MNKLQLRRGQRSNLPANGLLTGEPLLTTDTHELFVGDAAGNPVRIVDVIVSTIAPVTPVQNQLWLDITNDQLKKWSGSSWEQQLTATLGESLTNLSNDLSSVAAGKGASMIGVQDAAGHFAGTEVEAVLAEVQVNINTETTNRTNADTAAANNLASTQTGKGASLVGVEDAAGKFTATTVEGVALELQTNIEAEQTRAEGVESDIRGEFAAADTTIKTDLAATTLGKGAATVGIHDAAGNFTATTVEGVTAELQTNINAEKTRAEGVESDIRGEFAAADTVIKNDLASTGAGKGAALVGIQDGNGFFTAGTVEEALSELFNKIDATAAGLDIKQSTKVATTANLAALSGLPILDGYQVVDGDRILVKNQTTKSENGLYVAHAGVWIRTTDADNTPGAEFTSGIFVFVEEGTESGGTGFVVTSPNSATYSVAGVPAIELDVDDVVFTQFSAGSSYGAGTGIDISGQTIKIADTGIAAATYTKVTVNAQGQVTAAESPTTRAGYGLEADAAFINGDATELFQVADGAAQKDAVNRGQLDNLDAAKAALAGSSTQIFQVKDGIVGTDAVNFQQLETKALKNGDAAQAFAVADPSTGDDAVNRDYADARYVNSDETIDLGTF